MLKLAIMNSLNLLFQLTRTAREILEKISDSNELSAIGLRSTCQLMIDEYERLKSLGEKSIQDCELKDLDTVTDVMKEIKSFSESMTVLG